MNAMTEEKTKETKNIVITICKKFFFKVIRSFIFARFFKRQFVFSIFIVDKYISLDFKFFSENFSRHFLLIKQFTSL